MKMNRKVIKPESRSLYVLRKWKARRAAHRAGAGFIHHRFAFDSGVRIAKRGRRYHMDKMPREIGQIDGFRFIVSSELGL